jgi:hypothetical protein
MVVASASKLLYNNSIIQSFKFEISENDFNLAIEVGLNTSNQIQKFKN